MPPKQRAAEKNALKEIEMEKKAADEKEKLDAAEWSVGAKNDSRAKLQEEKEAEKLRKAAELAAIKAADEEALGGVKTVKKTKKKGKDDFDLLNAALANAPKTKAQKDAELKKKEQEERLKIEEEVRQAKEAKRIAEEAEIRKLAAKGIVVGHAEELMVPIHNRLSEDEDESDEEGVFTSHTGLDNVLDALSLGSSTSSQNVKAMYEAFYARTLPSLKEDSPGLKLSQYKDRIFDMWQSSPENPKNRR